MTYKMRSGAVSLELHAFDYGDFRLTLRDSNAVLDTWMTFDEAVLFAKHILSEVQRVESEVSK